MIYRPLAHAASAVNMMNAVHNGREPAVLRRDIKRVLTVRKTPEQSEISFPASRLRVHSL